MILRILGGLMAAIVAIVTLFVAFGSWYRVDEGERGVLLTNGRVTEVVGPGLNFKTPFFQSVVKIDLRQQVAYWGFEGERGAMEAYSKDSQPADMRVTVSWRIVPGKEAEFYSRYGGDPKAYETQVIARVAPEALKEVFGQYTAYTVISDRAKFNAAASDAITAAVQGVAMVDGVQVEDIAFTEQFEKAVDDRMKAEIDVAKKKQELEQEKVLADIKRTQAQATADATLANAKAEAEATRMQGDATAAAIEARAKALGSNPLLVDLTRAERWNGQLPATMVPGDTVPFLSMSQAAKTQDRVQ